VAVLCGIQFVDVLGVTSGITALPAMLAGVAVAGAGLGIASVAATAIGTDVAETLSGTAGGVLNTGAQLGTALGVAALLLLAATIGESGSGTAVAWAVAAGLAGLTGLTLLTRTGADTVAVRQG
jgi:hypothetical protein